MDIHKPKAAHSVSEFAREIGAVVLGHDRHPDRPGLALEQAVEAYLEHERASSARQNVHEEIAANVGFLKTRMASQPCLDRKLRDIRALLAVSGDAAKDLTPTWMSRPSFWSMGSGGGRLQNPVNEPRF